MFKGLATPWSLAFLPNGDMLITEKGGKLRIVRGGTLDPTPVAGTPEVFAVGQGGLLEVAVHPQFAQNQFVYLTYSKGKEKEGTTALARGRFDGKALVDVKDLLVTDNWNTGGVHFGSKLAVWQGRHALHERRRAQRPRPRAEHQHPRRQDPAPQGRRYRAAGQSVRGQGRIQARDLHVGSPQRAGPRRASRYRRGVGDRARAAGRRRAQPDRRQQELWLAGRSRSDASTAAR